VASTIAIVIIPMRVFNTMKYPFAEKLNPAGYTKKSISSGEKSSSPTCQKSNGFRASAVK